MFGLQNRGQSGCRAPICVLNAFLRSPWAISFQLEPGMTSRVVGVSHMLLDMILVSQLILNRSHPEKPTPTDEGKETSLAAE